MAFPTTGILDAFVDPSAPRNVHVYNPSWDFADGYSAIALRTTVLNTLTGGLAHAREYWTPVLAADLEVYVQIGVVPVTDVLSVYFRIQNPDDFGTHSFYRIEYEGPTSSLRLHCIKEGVDLGTIDTYGIPSMSVGDQWGASITGTAIVGYYKAAAGAWEEVLGGTDSNITGAGYIGLGNDDDVGTLTNFGGGAMAAPPAAAPITFTQGARW